MGTGCSFPAGKLPGHEADHSPPSSAEVKNECLYNSTPLFIFMWWCLVKKREKFSLRGQIQLKCSEIPCSIHIVVTNIKIKTRQNNSLDHLKEYRHRSQVNSLSEKK